MSYILLPLTLLVGRDDYIAEDTYYCNFTILMSDLSQQKLPLSVKKFQHRLCFAQGANAGNVISEL
jgi:hypothetical protein